MKTRMKLLSKLLAVLLIVTMCFGMLAEGLSAAAEGEPEDDYVTVTLNAGEYGYFEDPVAGELDVPHVKGSFFKPVTPTAVKDWYLFDGWYTGVQGRGDHYTEKTAIGDEDINLYANWLPNPATIPVIEPDTVYPMDIPYGLLLFSFTPGETAVYEAYTMENDPDAAMANIRILDDRLRTVAESKSLDYDFNAIASAELTANKTYYIEFGSVFGFAASYKGVIKRSELVPITFHANPDNAGDAYFDGDPSKVVKTIDVRKGDHIERYNPDGLEVELSADMNLAGWSLDPEAEEYDDEILATEPLDVYAVYVHYKSVILDANGGYFTSLGSDVTEQRYAYYPGWPFEPSYDVSIDDSQRKYAGWATTPDAEEPDIIEGREYDDLGKRLYAVYTDEVTVTFDANGGYLLGNPATTTYQTTFGKGHVFYAMHAEHEDHRMELMGWVDQDGVIIPYTSTTYPDYQYTKDTYLKALWGRYVTVDANGGCFFFDSDVTALSLLFPTFVPFSNDHIIDLVGEPINFDDMKYLAGWSTDWSAEEPDVTDGETDVAELTRIYAVWKDDSYRLVEGGDQSWTKGSSEGLTVTVKRTGDDTMTFSCFEGAKVDGEQVYYPDFSTDEGSLILTLQSDYLEKLAVGKHTLRLEFTEDAAVETTFTIAEPEKPSDPEKDTTKPDHSAPNTGDHTNVLLWVIVMGASFAVTVAAAVFIIVRRRKTRQGA